MDAFFSSTALSPENNPVEPSSASCSSASCCSSSSTSTDCVAGYADSELMLASQNPKKRAGRTKFKETRHPVYRGVRSRNSGKWVCEVRQPKDNSRVWLGTYPTAEMAARAHDVAVLALRGRSACLNFADSVWRLPVPESTNVSDIQKAAAMAAKMTAKGFIPAEDVVEVVEKNESPESVNYVDEEEVFGMAGVIAGMAEGLMLPPPQMVGSTNFEDNEDFCLDMSLWSF